MTNVRHDANLDKNGNTIQIEFEHQKIHEGNHYNISSFETLASGVSTVFAITPNDVKGHFVYEVSAISEIELNMYEGASVSGGASITPRNNNRSVGDNSNVTIIKDPTINTQGTKIASYSNGDASKNQKAQKIGEGSRNKEHILASGVTYLYEIISRDTDNTISYRGQWYEV